MCLIRSDMKHQVLSPADRDAPLDLPRLMQRIATYSARPRYTFMVLDLIERVAGANGRAGPLVMDGKRPVPIREWLGDTIAPTAARHPRRIAATLQVRTELKRAGMLPEDPAEAEEAIEAEVRERVRASGMTSVSRAVSELVRAGLLKRHYQGYRVDHENRGAQRQAVYTIPPFVRGALRDKMALL
jgi:hypothetical protein